MGVGHSTSLKGKGPFAASGDDLDAQLRQTFRPDGQRRVSCPGTVTYQQEPFHRLTLADADARRVLDELRGLLCAFVVANGGEGAAAALLAPDTDGTAPHDVDPMDAQHEALFEPFAHLAFANYGIGDAGLQNARLPLPRGAGAATAEPGAPSPSIRALDLLSHHPSLTSLDLSFNALTGSSVAAVVEALWGGGRKLQGRSDRSRRCAAPRLRSLSFAGNAIGREGCAALADWLAADADGGVEHADSDASTGAEQKRALGSVACPLEELSLFHCGLDDDAVTTLLAGLAGSPPNATLTVLDLRFNDITGHTLAYLRDDVLSRNTTLAVVLLESAPHHGVHRTAEPIDGAKRMADACTPTYGRFRAVRLPGLSSHRRDSQDAAGSFTTNEGGSLGGRGGAGRGPREGLRRRLLRRELYGVTPLPRDALAEVSALLAPRRAVYVAAQEEAARARLMAASAAALRAGAAVSDDASEMGQGDEEKCGSGAGDGGGAGDERSTVGDDEGDHTTTSAHALDEVREWEVEVGTDDPVRRTPAPTHPLLALLRGNRRARTRRGGSARHARLGSPAQVAAAMGDAEAHRDRRRRRPERVRGMPTHVEDMVTFNYKNGFDVVLEMSEATAARLRVVDEAYTRPRESRSGLGGSPDSLPRLAPAVSAHSTRRVRVAAHDIPSRNLRACWCAPRQAPLYSGTLHYHCKHEGVGGSAVGSTAAAPTRASTMASARAGAAGGRGGASESDGLASYVGCMGTSHRCSSADRDRGRGGSIMKNSSVSGDGGESWGSSRARPHCIG